MQTDPLIVRLRARQGNGVTEVVYVSSDAFDLSEPYVATPKVHLSVACSPETQGYFKSVLDNVN